MSKWAKGTPALCALRSIALAASACGLRSTGRYSYPMISRWRKMKALGFERSKIFFARKRCKRSRILTPQNSSSSGTKDIFGANALSSLLPYRCRCRWSQLLQHVRTHADEVATHKSNQTTSLLDSIGALTMEGTSYIVCVLLLYRPAGSG